jgi:AraC-like DNA-binding protein
MPLFIDLHIDNTLTPDLVKQCHIADKAVQEEYGVRYLQILLNQPQGYLFCLVEGPDKESCAKVHHVAHGNIACNLIEITESDFSALLANKKTDGLDFTLNHDGTLDTGNRAILALDLLGSSENYRAAKHLINQVLHQLGGRTGESFENRLLAVFDSCASAAQAGIAISNKIRESLIPIEVRLGLDMGPPLKEKGNFFEDVCKSADHFSFISMNGQITVSSKVMQLLKEGAKNKIDPVKVVSPADEKFLNTLMACVERVWQEEDITIEGFSRELGMSKSQLGRKLKSLTTMSPNDFLKEFRLRKAIRLMEDHSMNIAQVTMAIGFTNPSYFTKCFRKRFGKAPSDFQLTA